MPKSPTPESMEKKLREAAFFLEKLRQQCDGAFGDREPVDFYLSAFLSAGYAVENRHRKAIKNGGPASPRATVPGDAEFVKFMVDDRNMEIHENGSSRILETVDVPVHVGTTYKDRSGSFTVTGPPDCPPGSIGKPALSFVMNGKPIPMLECCDRFLQILRRFATHYHVGDGTP